MSAELIDQRVERVVDRVIEVVRGKYPHITGEGVYDPPDRGVAAWVRLHGVEDADEFDEIRQFAHTVTDPAWDDEGILILIHTGGMRNPTRTGYPFNREAIAAAITAYKRRVKADHVMAEMARAIHRVFPELPVDAEAGGPEGQDGWFTIHIPEIAAPAGFDTMDVADSLDRLVSDPEPATAAPDAAPARIHVTHEVDPALNDPALSIRLVRHFWLVETLGELYPLVHVADPDHVIEIEVGFYPPAGGDACLILHGASADDLTLIQRHAQSILAAARAQHGLQIRLERGEARDAA